MEEIKKLKRYGESFDIGCIYICSVDSEVSIDLFKNLRYILKKKNVENIIE